MRRIAVVVGICGVLVACRRAPSVRLDPAAIRLEAAARTERVLARPRTDGRLDALLAAIAADPEIRERGTALFEVLAADPAISQAAAHITEALGNSPELRQAVIEIMRAHPDAKPDQIGELMSARLETTWATPAINHAWMTAWNRLLPRLDLGVVPRIFATIGARLDAYFEARSQRWAERLTELNGGQELTPERASQLYIDHAWSEARIAKFVDASLANPRLQSELIAAVRRLLRIEVVRGALRDAASAMSGDATVQDAAIALIRQLSLASPSPESVQREIDRLLQAPVTAQTVHQLMTRVLADPEVPRILVDGLDHLSADRQLADSFDELIDRW